MEQEKKKLNGMVKEFLTYDNQIAQTEKILKKYRDNLKVAKENREKLKKTIYNQMKILDTEELSLGEIEGRTPQGSPTFGQAYEMVVRSRSTRPGIRLTAGKFTDL